MKNKNSKEIIARLLKVFKAEYRKKISPTLKDCIEKLSVMPVPDIEDLAYILVGINEQLVFGSARQSRVWQSNNSSKNPRPCYIREQIEAALYEILDKGYFEAGDDVGVRVSQMTTREEVECFFSVNHYELRSVK